MNSNFLLKYLDVRFAGELAEPPAEHKQMVVTMSRDTGCDGMPILQDVVKNLNANLKGASKKQPWTIASKEIFEESARKLNVKVSLLDHLEQERTVVEEFLNSFADNSYPSDWKIKKTFKEVIQSIERQGGVFILGRGGVAIVEHNRRNLHISVTAPLEWRVQKMMKEYGTTESSARKHILQSDKNRADLKKYYKGRKVHLSDYDIVFNEATLTKKEISKAIQNIILLKQN